MVKRDENVLKAIRFQRPDTIPMTFGISAACWHHYDQEALKDLMESHPLLFPGYARPAGEVKPSYLRNARAGEPYTDPWGCVWGTTDDGITGAVHGHPLESWESFGEYRMPDPEKTDGTYPVDWSRVAEGARAAREAGRLVWGGLPHGHTFLRLQDIRGYTSFTLDLADAHPNAIRLIGMVEEFNARYVAKWMTLGPDVFGYGDDLGMQVGPMISPQHFREYLKPVYRRLMKLAIDRGCIVQMHSDGDVRALAEDLVDAGVQVLNIQDLVNGIDWIASRYAGRVCIELDIDRMAITRFGAPRQIDALIREEVTKLGSPRGGLMMIHGMYPGVPLENARALMDAMERYATHFS
jgi:uroporphyrinogen decarboxylase